MTNNNETISIEAVLNKSIYNGYSDSELELLAEPPEVDKGIASWVYWTSELYSIGRLYREWAYYPRWLPLYIYSDHGVHKLPKFAPHELNNTAKIHLVFNAKRVLENSTTTKKEVLCVPHPWVTYRRRNNITQLKDAKGTLVFFAHSSNGVEMSGHDTDEYFDALNKLPDRYKPLVLCMHMHDIKKGYHKKLRKFGLPIVTAGATSSIKFVDCFYNMVKQFSYATSNVGGSQLYYCVEMGIPYFLFGEKIKMINYSDSNFPVGNVDVKNPIQKELVNIERSLFENKTDSVSLHQKIYVEWMLGLNSDVTRFKASWILWKEFFRHWIRWYILFQPLALWFLRKLDLVEEVKKYLNKYGKGKK